MKILVVAIFKSVVIRVYLKLGHVSISCSGNVPGEKYWDIFSGHFIAKENSRDTNCPGICPDKSQYSTTS